MRQFSYWRAFYSSFYSSDLYRDVAKNWGAGVLLYLLMVLTMAWWASMFHVQRSVDRGFERLSDEYVPQVPHIKIEKGVLKTPEKRPYFIRNSDNQVDAIIDTSGRYTNLDETDSYILVTDHEMMVKDNQNRIRIDKIPADLTLDLEPQEVKEMLRGYIKYAWIYLFPFLLFFSFIYRLIQALLYALIGKLYSAFFNVQLSYTENLKIAMVAVTPAIVFATFLEAFQIVIQYQMLCYLGISIGYIIFAIKSNKNK